MRDLEREVQESKTLLEKKHKMIDVFLHLPQTSQKLVPNLQDGMPPTASEPEAGASGILRTAQRKIGSFTGKKGHRMAHGEHAVPGSHAPGHINHMHPLGVAR